MGLSVGRLAQAFPTPSGMVHVAKSLIHGTGLFASVPIPPGRIIEDHPTHGLNHSCEPNAIIVRHRVGHSVGLVAIRFIDAGEELTCDYRHGSARTQHATDSNEANQQVPFLNREACSCPTCRVKP